MAGTRLDVKIERLRRGSGDRLRSIRLSALADAPDAFGTTHREAAAESSESWETEVQQKATYVAVVVGRDVGLVRGAHHEQAVDAAYLISMWVSPRARRRGVATALIDAVVSWARAEGLGRLVLDVAENNLPALGLYGRYGFVPNGVLGGFPPPREHIREIQLELSL